MPAPSKAFQPYASAHVNPAGPGDARPTALQVIEDQNLLSEPYPLKGQTYFITGCSVGLGKETARVLHATGADIYMTVRDGKGAEGETVVKEILQGEKDTGFGCPAKGKLEVVEMDLSSFDSVRRGAKDFLSRSSRLDVLILNAGVCMCPQWETSEKWEMHMGTNHFGHFLLFQLLKDRMLESIASSKEKSSRVVVVSSGAHRSSAIRWDDMNFQKGGYNAYQAYGQSKTANIYMASSIDRLYGPKGLRAVSLHPGPIFDTSAVRHMSKEARDGMINAIGPLMKNIEQGAATQVWAATSKHFLTHGGVYLADVGEEGELWKEDEPAAKSGYAVYAYDKDGEDKLWNLSCEAVGVPEG